MSEILFYFFGAITLVSAIMVISSRNPVHSVLFLIIAFCASAGLLILIEAEFMAMIFIVVYVGAVAIVFLFVIMMLNIKHATVKEAVRGRIARYFPVGGILSFISLIAILYVLSKDSTMMSLSALPSESSSLTVSYMQKMENAPYLA